MYKPRLQRLKWLFTDRPLFFLTATTHTRRRLLDGENLHQAFLAFCQKGQAHGVFVGRYVLMPDHLHCFVGVGSGGLSLSKWVQILKVTLAKSLRAQGHEGPFWQKGFFDHLSRSGESYRRKWEYVRANPVRAGLVERAEDWPYQGEVFQVDL